MSLVDLFQNAKDKELVAELVRDCGMSEDNLIRAAIRLYQTVRVRASVSRERMVLVDASGKIVEEPSGCMGDE